MIQGFAHAGGGALRDEGLDDIGQIFEDTEKKHGAQIIAAVEHQFIDAS